jgi:hypothetical protein
MQQENYVSTMKMTAIGLWAVTFTLLAIAWVFVLHPGLPTNGGWLIALTAGVFAPAAGVAHIKLYAMKVTSLIRVTSGLQQDVSGPSESTVMHRIH